MIEDDPHIKAFIKANISERWDQAMQDEIMLRVAKHIDVLDETRAMSASDRRDVWQRCYASHHAGTVPPFLHPEPNTPVRLNGRYEIPCDPLFEANFLALIRQRLFDMFLADVDSVYEFGCGTGHNLVALAKQYPGKKLVGLDWSSHAVRLIDQLADKHGTTITGHEFNFLDPDRSLQLGDNAGVLTIGALEQIGFQWAPFLMFLLQSKPAVCVHLEPIVELYDDEDLFDYVAAKYHRKRGYLEGFMPILHTLQGDGTIEIIDEHRIKFGSLYHEAYTYIAWRPA